MKLTKKQIEINLKNLSIRIDEMDINMESEVLSAMEEYLYNTDFSSDFYNEYVWWWASTLIANLHNITYFFIQCC